MVFVLNSVYMSSCLYKVSMCEEYVYMFLGILKYIWYFVIIIFILIYIYLEICFYLCLLFICRYVYKVDYLILINWWVIVGG